MKHLISVADICPDRFELLEHLPAVQVPVMESQHFITDPANDVFVVPDLLLNFVKSGLCIGQPALQKRRKLSISFYSRKRLTQMRLPLIGVAFFYKRLIDLFLYLLDSRFKSFLIIHCILSSFVQTPPACSHYIRFIGYF